jgi:hypothetical protein
MCRCWRGMVVPFTVHGYGRAFGGAANLLE